MDTQKIFFEYRDFSYRLLIQVDHYNSAVVVSDLLGSGRLYNISNRENIDKGSDEYQRVLEGVGHFPISGK